MRRHSALPAILTAATLAIQPLAALPNAILGGIVRNDSPLDGQDLTPQLIAAATWSGGEPLPGDWRTEGRIAAATISHLLAQPKLLDHDVVLLRATHRDDRLVLLEATFADAGSFFGYYDEALPDGLTRLQQREHVAARLATRQTEFATLFGETLAGLRQSLTHLTKDPRPRSTRLGRSRHLRTESEDYRHGDLALRLLHADQRLIRLQIARAGELPDGWTDLSLAGLSDRQRLERLADSVERRDDGTVLIPSLHPIPQGYQPYCGINTLAMSARHFGLHIDEDWLAAAAGFRNTGSAAGSNLPRVYRAVATEAGLSLDQSNRFNPSAARRAISSGLPVVVWRRFSSQRNQLHTRLARSPGASLPDPADPAERASWPDEDAPLHSSVLVGYHDARHEFLLLESWSGRDTPRRMRSEELEATAYLTFVFTR